MLDEMRTLYRYNAWANGRVLERAAALSQDQFLRELDGAGSPRGILVHLVDAQWVWLERCQGRSPAAFWDAAAFPDVATLRHRWEEVERDQQAFLAGLRAADLEREVAYTNMRDERWAYPLWQVLLHQVNHATQHRGEAAVILTRCGQSPGDLDFLIYIDERNAPA
jgi:uncharacterized damage-inducible protein DinB